MDLTPKQQTSEAIRQAESILVTTGQHPSVDQAAAVIALGMILRKFNKKVTAIVSDSLPASLAALNIGSVDKDLSGLRDFIVRVDLGKSEVDKVKYTMEEGKLNIHLTPFRGGFTASDVTFDYGSFHYDLAIVLGVPTKARIDRVLIENQKLFDTVPVLNLDFHRSNEGFGAVNLIEPTASSLSEILVALAESLQNGIIDENIATVLLCGIVASTDRFTASHTTSKSLTVAAQLMAAGGKQPLVVRALYQRDQRSSERSGSGRNDRQNRSSSARPQNSGRGPDGTNTTQGGAVAVAQPASSSVEVVKSESSTTSVQASSAEPQL